MANREACELYIEQEIKAGLEEGKKPYSIGKDLSVWIEELFEVNINPETIKKRAQRLQNENGTNVPSDSTTSNDSENKEIKEIKRAKDGTLRGGKREGAGRPLKHKKKKPIRPPIPKEQIFEDRFKNAFDKFYEEVKNAKKEKWEKTTKEAALYSVSLLTDLITIS